MIGITSYGAYVPIYRLSREEIARAWGGRAAPGEKAVANFDEDSATMAVEAVIDCLKGIDRQTVDGLYFASTTSPYVEIQ
jgi:hydroxymethylglutaryl-CoA synthase